MEFIKIFIALLSKKFWQDIAQKLHQERTVKWVSGPIICLICSHEWVAVRPEETQLVECPNCGFENETHHDDLLH